MNFVFSLETEAAIRKLLNDAGISPAALQE
jgi:hypothetical protein